MPDRIVRTIGASVVLVGLAVAGIAQVRTNGDPAPAEVDVGETTTTSEASLATTVPDPFTYRIGVLSGVSTTNFWAYYGEQPSVWNSYMLGPTKPALFQVDPRTSTLDPEVAVAEANPTPVGDKWVVRIAMNDAFHWSDGQPITARDFVFTFDTVRALDLGGSWADSFPTAVESVRADGDYRLVIEFGEQPNLEVWPYGVGLAPIMPEHVWEPSLVNSTAAELFHRDGGLDVGGGPLALKSASDTRVVSVANPGYPSPVAPNTVEYLVFDDEQSLVDGVVSGAVDMALTPKGLTRDELSAIAGHEGVATTTSPANGVRYLGFNLAREPMSSRAFRTALALILDRGNLSETIDTDAAAFTFVPPSNARWYDQNAAAEIESRYTTELATRLTRALSELTDAGYQWTRPPAIEGGQLVRGEGLTINGVVPRPLTILTAGDDYDPVRPVTVEHIALTLGILGFDVRPVETDFDTVVDLAFSPAADGSYQYDMYMLGWTLGSPALPSFYRPLFAGDGEMNSTGYHSGEFDSALASYEKATSDGAAYTALWSMERILSEDLPYLPLYRTDLSEIYRSDRVTFDSGTTLGGIQGRLGAIGDVQPVR